ncbi:MAG: hypothetical protein LHV69_01110 [Elusimicrobia bacterium]|nr:hypothetical protein [Candidatus Obscuribacterium magneticum]
MKPKRRFSDKRPTWLFSLVVLLVSYSLGGLVLLQNQLSRSLDTEMKNFSWLVVVQGDTIEVDEVGRLLRQREGVKDVRLLSPEEVFNRLNQDPLLSENLRTVGPAFFPVSWMVEWLPSELAVDRQDNHVREIRQIPGVLDIAFDEKSLRSLHILRRHWLQARVLLVSLTLLGLLVALIFLGRLLFFTSKEGFDFTQLAMTTFFDELAWVIGILLVSATAGQAPLYFYMGGLILGPFHYLWWFQNEKKPPS